jgi:hypothetical protein
LSDREEIAADQIVELKLDIPITVPAIAVLVQALYCEGWNEENI